MKDNDLTLEDLRNLMQNAFGIRGLTMHKLYSSILAQEVAKENGEKQREWSIDEGTELTPIEDERFTRSFPSDFLERINQISKEELERLENDSSVTPDEIEPIPDFTAPGTLRNDREWLDTDDVQFIINPDGWMRRRGQISCGQVWHLHLYMGRTIANCQAANYEALFKELLTRGAAEAHLACKPTNCEKAKMWLFNSLWECNPGMAGRFEEQCIIEIVVVCVAA